MPSFHLEMWFHFIIRYSCDDFIHNIKHLSTAVSASKHLQFNYFYLIIFTWIDFIYNFYLAKCVIYIIKSNKLSNKWFKPQICSKKMVEEHLYTFTLIENTRLYELCLIMQIRNVCTSYYDPSLHVVPSISLWLL